MMHRVVFFFQSNDDYTYALITKSSTSIIASLHAVGKIQRSGSRDQLVTDYLLLLFTDSAPDGHNDYSYSYVAFISFRFFATCTFPPLRGC